MAELLVELFSEEIPARMQTSAADQLVQLVSKKLSENGIAFQRADGYVTPRRLVLIMDGLPTVKESSTEEKRGPRVGAPEKAIEGFLKSNGLQNINDLEVRNTDKGEFYFAVTKEGGKEVSDILQEVLEETLKQFSWPKSMKWNDYYIRWVRPLHHILCIFDGKAIPVTFGHLTASNTTKGHRFLSKDTITVTSAKQYWEALHQHHVILSQEERKQYILEEAEKQAEEHGLLLKHDEALLQEITGLVEWPVVLLGNIDPKFMHLPPEVLTTSMRYHQKYFSLLDRGGNLAPHFLTVSNMVSKDKGAHILTGNERVLRARLEDAKFFWEQDINTGLEANLPALDNIIFHAKLGTVADKVKRVGELAKFLSVWVPHANLTLVGRAAELCKADLTSEMVQEFPELQGVMGKYYAEHAKEDNAVVQAMHDHYLPLGPSSDVPTEPVSVAVALADKIDTLVGLFAANEKPTGSKDPFALRRAALGVIRIILENKLRIPLRLLLEKSLKSYPKVLLKPEVGLAKKLLRKRKSKKATEDGEIPDSEKAKEKFKRIVNDLLDFFADRLKVLLKEQEVRYDLINAVFDGGGEDDLLRLVNRAFVLESFLQTSDGINLLSAYKRATNIVHIEEKKDANSYADNPVKSLLQESAEETLFYALKEVETPVSKALQEERFADAMKELSVLRSPLDQFFDDVKVNCEHPEVRQNRLRILSQIQQFLNKIANFEKIEHKESA